MVLKETDPELEHDFVVTRSEEEALKWLLQTGMLSESVAFSGDWEWKLMMETLVA